MAGPLGKRFLRTAGTMLGSYLDDAFRLGGNVGQNLATSALQAGKAKFAPQLVGKTGKEVPVLLREGAKSAIPTAGRLLGQGTVLGTGLAAAGMLDQQSEYSQQLQNQKFMHDMALVQMRAESRIPGAQYPGSLQEQQAFSQGVLNEVGAIGRMTLGTGVRL